MSEELAPYVAAPMAALAGPLSGDPVVVLAASEAIATKLKDVIEKQNLYVTIAGKKCVLAEGWTTMGAMLGVFPRTDWMRPITIGAASGWESRVTLVHAATGKDICAGESMCLSDEVISAEGKTRADSEQFELRSMSATRATVRAYKLGFSWIMTLSGYAATPADEMPHDAEKRYAKPSGPAPAQAASSDEWIVVDTKDYPDIKGNNKDILVHGFKWKSAGKNPDGSYKGNPQLMKRVVTATVVEEVAPPAEDPSQVLFWQIVKRIGDCRTVTDLEAAGPTHYDKGQMTMKQIERLDGIFAEAKGKMK